MTLEQAMKQIDKAINEYDDGVIQRSSLSTVITETLKTYSDESYDTGYRAGLDDTGAVEPEDEFYFEDDDEDDEDDEDL